MGQDSQSAFFAVRFNDDATIPPNMVYEEIMVTATTGVTLAFGTDTKLLCAKMAEAAEETDAVMGFRIRVLVNNVDLKRGDLLTRPARAEPRRERAAPDAIRPGNLLKKLKKN